MEKLVHELKALGAATLFFLAWMGFLLLLKVLFLSEYGIAFAGLSKAFIGALVLAKVALILENVPLGAWVWERPAWIDVVSRTALYTAGAFLVILLERSFEARHEHGGLFAAMAALLGETNKNHVLADTLGIGCALLNFNALTVIREALDSGTLRRIFTSPRETPAT